MHVFTDVPTWLKSLRLHKYAYLFQQMTYEEMLTVSEDWLETQVTPHTVQFTYCNLLRLKSLPNFGIRLAR